MKLTAQGFSELQSERKQQRIQLAQYLRKKKVDKMKVFSKVVDLNEEIRLIYCSMVEGAPTEERDWMDLADRCERMSAEIRKLYK